MICALVHSLSWTQCCQIIVPVLALAFLVWPKRVQL